GLGLNCQRVSISMTNEVIRDLSPRLSPLAREVSKFSTKRCHERTMQSRWGQVAGTALSSGSPPCQWSHACTHTRHTSEHGQLHPQPRQCSLLEVLWF